MATTKKLLIFYLQFAWSSCSFFSETHHVHNEKDYHNPFSAYGFTPDTPDVEFSNTYRIQDLGHDSHSFINYDNFDHQHHQDKAATLTLGSGNHFAHTGNHAGSSHQQAPTVQTLNANPFWFNELETLSLPFYFTAEMHYPLHQLSGAQSAENNEPYLKVIDQAISGSSFKDVFPNSPIPHTSLLDKIKLEKIGMQGFLLRLCLKNLQFLLCINEGKPDEKVELEILQSLNWLHKIIWEDPQTEHDHIRKLVNRFLETKHEYTTWAYIGHSDSATARDKKSSNVDAEECRIMIIVLGTYYKESNRGKWGNLFPKDEAFLEFFMKLKKILINRSQHRDMKRYHNVFEENDFLLPWNNIISNEISLESFGTLFADRDRRDIMGKRVFFIKDTQSFSFNPASFSTKVGKSGGKRTFSKKRKRKGK